MNNTNIINRTYKVFFNKDITKVYEIIGTILFLFLWLALFLILTKNIYNYVIDPNIINKIIADFKTNNSHFLLSTYSKYNFNSYQIISILSIFFMQIFLNMFIFFAIYSAWLLFGYPNFGLIRNYVNKQLSIPNNTFGFKLKPFFNDTYIFLLNTPILIILTYVTIIFLPSILVITILEKIITPLFKKIDQYTKKRKSTSRISQKPTSVPQKREPWYYSILFFLNLALFFTFIHSLNDTPKSLFISFFDERLVFNSIFFILFINIVYYQQLKKFRIIQSIYIIILFYTYDFNSIQYLNGLHSLCLAIPFVIIYYINHKFNIQNKLITWIKDKSNKDVKVKYNIAKDILDHINKDK